MSIYIKAAFMAVSTLIVMLDILIFLVSKNVRTERTGQKVFLSEDMFFVGAFVAAHTRWASAAYGRRVKKLEELYEPLIAKQIGKNSVYSVYTYILLFLPPILFAAAASGNWGLTAAMLGCLVFMCFYFDAWLSQRLKERRKKILYDFATMLSKMSLLVNAGITATDAFERVAYSSEGIVYEEMKKTTEDIKSGVPYEKALEDLSFRTGCKEMRKFVSVYKQNLSKGGPEFPSLLREMSNEAWEDRKMRARLAGSEASQRLLIPIMLMFIGVLIMVIVPAFKSLIN